ncbi:MAG: mevalonate kinase [Methanothrix sp.]|nr:mevalonate kinase [Methanothrix sp.]
MTAASAPGKVILFGEHAVVSGATALGGAIDLRAKVTLQDLPGRILIDANNLTLRGFSFDLITGQVLSAEAAHATRYVSAVLKEYEAKDLRVKVESNLPPAAGLGSSAAIVVATTAALNQHFGLGLSRKEIASDAHRMEKAVQQGLGSPMDTALATFGGYLQISRRVQPLDLPSLEIVVGYTERAHDTRSEVEKVQSLLARYPDLVGPIFQAIGAISSRAVSLIQEQRLEELGEMMNINHGLLEAVGVGTRELSELVYASRGAGSAYGAKLTGAGGGGCMIALPPTGGSAALITALRQAKGTAFSVKTGSEGVRLERDL